LKESNGRRKKVPRVLVISAHPDDVDFGCAGTLAKWASQDAEIFYTICTSGEKGTDDPTIPNHAMAVTREKEQRDAAEVVGAKEVIYLRKPDGELQSSLEFRGELVRVIRKFRPDIVFTHDPANRSFDNQYMFHSDHRVVGELAFDAVYPAALNRNYFPGHLAEGLSPHAVAEMYFFATAQPDTWIDIASTIEIKIKALRCHTSQIKNPKIMEEFVRTMFRTWGKEKGLVYAERFRRLPIFHDPAQRFKKMKGSIK
jgi:LmbE family N-acetylglucosaminyl deacetylase